MYTQLQKPRANGETNICTQLIPTKRMHSPFNRYTWAAVYKIFRTLTNGTYPRSSSARALFTMIYQGERMASNTDIATNSPEMKNQDHSTRSVSVGATTVSLTSSQQGPTMPLPVLSNLPNDTLKGNPQQPRKSILDGEDLASQMEEQFKEDLVIERGQRTHSKRCRPGGAERDSGHYE